MHPGGHETVDSEFVELEVIFKMGHCAGFCNGVKKKLSPSGMEFATVAKKTCGPFIAAAAEDAIRERVKAPLSQTLHVDALHWEVGRQDEQRLRHLAADGSSGRH